MTAARAHTAKKAAGTARAMGCTACQACVWAVLAVDGTETVTLDADRDPAGTWLLEAVRGDWRARPMRPGEIPEPGRARYRAHTDTCRLHRARSQATLGPCMGPGCTRVTVRYGPQGKPLCPQCRNTTG